MEYSTVFALILPGTYLSGAVACPSLSLVREREARRDRVVV